MLLTVHDELVFEIAPEEEQAMRGLVRQHMEHAHELDVPLVVDLGVGRTWNEAH
jgi:DNA polymerase-1